MAALRCLDAIPRIWLDVAMMHVNIAELKDQLSSHLRAVERGAEVVVTDRGRPIARIVPMGEVGTSLVVRPPRRPFSSIRGKRHAPARWGVDSTDLLLEERQRR
jgi:prevent-host-death family protein